MRTGVRTGMRTGSGGGPCDLSCPALQRLEQSGLARFALRLLCKKLVSQHDLDLLKELKKSRFGRLASGPHGRYLLLEPSDLAGEGIL